MKCLFAAVLVVFAILDGLSQRSIATFSSITTTKAIDDKVFFTATHETYGTELFVSDGSAGNATLLKDINPGYTSSTPGQLTVLNNQLFFTAYSPEYGLSVWKSDGTAEGTKMVYGVSHAEPSNLMVFKGKLYFTTNLGSIIRTDGTSGGTAVYYQSEFTGGRISTVIKNDQYIYFTAGGRTIYRDDGSSRIDFLGPLSWEDVYFKHLFVIDNVLVAIKSSTYDHVIRIYAISNDVLGGEEDAEWVLIKKLDAPIYGSQEIENFTNVAGKLFFSFRTDFDNVTPTDELWICDGTEAGTKKLTSFGWDPHYYQSEMDMFFAFNGKLFFRGGNTVNSALWTSDGTTEGTMKYHDVILTAPYNDERTPVLINENNMYFSGSDGGAAAIWSSNGTPEGTQKVLDVEDNDGGVPHDFSFSNDVLYFVTSQQFSSALWSTVPSADISVRRSGSSIIKSGSKAALFYGVSLGACKSSDVIVTNQGLEVLYLGDIFLTGKDFHLVQQALPEALAPGESVTIQIVFNPVTEGTARATLTIITNDNNEPKYVIYLEGTPSTFGTVEICEFPEAGYVKSLRPGEVVKPIVLSNSSIAEGHPGGTVIGAFSFPLNSTFLLVPGEGDTDNQQFFIDGNLLKSNTVFNFNMKTLYSLRVKATSGDGESEASFRIAIINASPGFVEGDCQLTFERMSFSYTSLETNADAHLFTTTSSGQIHRSMDAGNHWDVVYAGDYAALSGITFKGNTGFAQGPNFLVKSDDGGATWFKVYIPFTGEYYFGSLAVFFFNDKEGFVGTDEGEIFFTGDGGRTWETRMKGSWHEFRDLFFLSKEKGYATVGYGDLLQTVDGGRSWTGVDLSALGWNTRVRDILFTNENDGFMIGEYKFYTTSDGGKTWNESQTVSGNDVGKIKFFDASLGFLYAGNGLMYRTTNGGDNWDLNLPSISPGQIVGIAQSSGKLFIATKNYYYSYDAARSLAVSSDEGVTWSTLNYFSDANIYSIDFSLEEKGFVIGQNGMFETEDNGVTWKQAVTDLANVGDIHLIDENTVIMLSGGHIYKSTDGGATTRTVLTTEQGEVYLPAGKLYGFPGDILFSVSWYAVYRSVDQGETWDLVSTNPGYYTQGMHFISPDTGYRVELFGSVEKTIDGGETWTEIFTRAPEASDAFNAIFFLNENLGYKGGEFLQSTTDGGIHWEKVNWPFYEILGIHFESENHGYVVTRGGSVYETNNAAVTWETIYSAPSRISDVQFGTDGIFLAGENGFVARMNTAPGPPSLPGYIYGPDHICAGDAVEFYVAVNSGNRTQWKTTASNIEDHSGYVTVSFSEPGEYTITAKHFNACGVSESRTTSVVVSAPPDAPIIEGPDEVVAGELDVKYTIVNGNEHSNFLWEAKGSSSTSPVENGVIIDWGETVADGEIKVLEVDASGCRAYGSLVVTLDMVLAIESELQNSVSIYPNPSDTDTNISSSFGKLLVVRIMDTLGREYLRTTLSGEDEQVMETRQLPAGLYLVEISDGIKSVTKKLIRK